jgi:hypothetical protein
MHSCVFHRGQHGGRGELGEAPGGFLPNIDVSVDLRGGGAGAEEVQRGGDVDIAMRILEHVSGEAVVSLLRLPEAGIERE